MNNFSEDLEVEIDEENQAFYLSFSSKRALYEFAQSLMQNSLFGVEGCISFQSTRANGGSCSLRLAADSASMHAVYPDKLFCILTNAQGNSS